MVELRQLFDLVDSYRATNLMLNIETKVEAAAPHETAPRELFVRRVWEEIRDAGMTEQVTIQSFDWGALMVMHTLAPDLPLVALTNFTFLQVGQPGASVWLGGIDVDDFGGDFVAAAASIDGVTALSPVQGFPQNGTISDPEFDPYPDEQMIADAHRRGLEVIPWTIDDPATMDYFIDLGVDGIITNYPDRLRAVMADNGMRLPAPSRRRAVPYSLLQMNLCLSGFAGCFDDTQYPKIVEEAIDVIRARKPKAVTFNEACSGDAARIARRTGYRMRFATVLISGAPLECIDPGGRGVFGNAVMTKEAITDSTDRAFTAQAGSEERRWICVGTARGVEVCTTHLSTRGSDAARAANDGQCVELAAILAGSADGGPTIAAGDINRQDSCAAAGMWTLTDAEAVQLPGIQHSYGSAEDFLAPQVEIVPATFTDHDFMLITTRLVPPTRL